MNFINPKTDFAFKKIFGSAGSKDILISFLNATLYEGQPIIEDLEVLDPYQAAQIKGVKETFLDVKAAIKDGSIVIIEMQVLNVEAFGKRVLYNAAKAYSLQLVIGRKYKYLRQVIALTITDFEMFKDRSDIISRFVFKEKKHHFDYPNNDLEMVFIELPKFRKELSELETLTDKWIYFMKNTGSLESVPETMGRVPEIQRAFEIANAANLSREEFDAIERQTFFIEDQLGAIAKGIEQGREQGIEQGREQGIEQGREQGIKEGKSALIVRLLERRVGEIAPDIQTRIRELSTNQLENLGEAMLDFTNASDLIAWLQTASE